MLAASDKEEIKQSSNDDQELESLDDDHQNVIVREEEQNKLIYDKQPDLNYKAKEEGCLRENAIDRFF